MRAVNRDFLIQFLEYEHLTGNEGLSEIAIDSGLDVVKLLIVNHGQTRVYIPDISGNRALIKTAIQACLRKGFTVDQISKKIGMRKKYVQELINEIKTSA